VDSELVDIIEHRAVDQRGECNAQRAGVRHRFCRHVDPEPGLMHRAAYHVSTAQSAHSRGSEPLCSVRRRSRDGRAVSCIEFSDVADGTSGATF
jgi:hypothetical protein